MRKSIRTALDSAVPAAGLMALGTLVVGAGPALPDAAGLPAALAGTGSGWNLFWSGMPVMLPGVAALLGIRRITMTPAEGSPAWDWFTPRRPERAGLLA
ncbi:hypothetical protein ACFQ36_20185 [Arthrobacter sp. GCM10027362]|uniref:hypothetical protein n=1 Tax=Arthrobacter sp. GCM10027362 TaxID=3273379 RepID=UPI003642A3E5